MPFDGAEKGRPEKPRRWATFLPQRLHTLRPEVAQLAGERAEWLFAGVGGADESYPGQKRWITPDARWQGYWAPEEDLVFE